MAVAPAEGPPFHDVVHLRQVDSFKSVVKAAGRQAGLAHRHLRHFRAGGHQVFDSPAKGTNELFSSQPPSRRKERKTHELLGVFLPVP